MRLEGAKNLDGKNKFHEKYWVGDKGFGLELGLELGIG